MRFLDSLLPLHHLLIASFPFEAYYVRLWTCVTLVGSLLQHGDWADIFRSATWTRLAYWHESGYSFAVSRIFSWLISILQISFPYDIIGSCLIKCECLLSESYLCLSQRFIKYELHISPTRTERPASNVFSSPSLEQFFGSVWCLKQIKRKMCKYYS